MSRLAELDADRRLADEIDLSSPPADVAADLAVFAVERGLDEVLKVRRDHPELIPHYRDRLLDYAAAIIRAAMEPIQ